jgi:GNAT superfamily N-acetyltransferase
MRLEAWRPAHLALFVRSWNRWFAGRPHFGPLTAARFRAKVLGRSDFDPAGLVLALEGRELAGFVHAGRRPRQGTVAFLWVDPGRRGRDVGTRLWHAGRERAREAGQVVVLNPWENPFYGSVPGERPLWGTPFGPAVEWGDSATLKFLARRGYAPAGRAVGLRLAIEAGRSGRPRGIFRVGGAAFGAIGPGVFALSRPALGAPRELGKGAARRLLARALAAIGRRGGRACEVLAFPDPRPREYASYLEAGFAPVGSWAVF